VFDRFYQGSAARTGTGSGLGLSIVAALAEAHGGRATVESTPGEGCTFAVELPLDIWGPRAGAEGRVDAVGHGREGTGTGDDTGAPPSGRTGSDHEHLVRPLPL